MDVTDLDADPLRQLATWLDAARAAGQPMPEAMTIASATSDGVPSARLVVLRGLQRGLVFFTDCESDKGAELAANPRAAAVLHWLVPAHRQVRVAGPAEPVSQDEADEYWSRRAPAVRVSAAASRQSRVVASRAVLVTQARDMLRHHPGGADVPRPRRWGGFRVLPSRVEFWQESPDGLHDRIRYRRGGSGWIIERLSPLRPRPQQREGPHHANGTEGRNRGGTVSAPPLPGFLNSLAGPLNHYGLWAVLLFVMIEDFGIPVPGETILIAASVYAGTGRLNVVAVALVGFAAAVTGDNIGFAIGHFGGRALALRWGRYVFLTEERLDKAAGFFDRHGAWIITVARFIEGLRQANGIVAGITGMNWLRFVAFNALGAALWVGTWVSVGYLAGSHIGTIYGYITRYSYYVLIALGVVVVALIARHLLRRRRARRHPAPVPGRDPKPPA